MKGAGISISALLLAFAGFAGADESPKYSERGVQAYRAGKYDLARLFFARALQDAILKGREDWAAKAALNLADLELEAMDEAEVRRLLDGITARDAATRSLAIWKRSQLSFLQHHYPEAVAFADSALRLGPPDAGAESSIKLDRLRYLMQSREPAAWAAEYETVSARLKASKDGRAVTLEAAAAMARGDFSRAERLWEKASAHYRERGRLAKVATCMNQIAICHFSLGRRQAAVDANARAVALFAELGLAMPGLRAEALRLLLVEDDREVAKLREDMDLLGQRYSGFDLQGILDEYSNSMRAGAPPQGGDVGDGRSGPVP